MLEAFGATDAPRPLTGGQGTSWLVGDLALEPDGGPVHEWVAGPSAGQVLRGCRVAAPVTTVDGDWLTDGWSPARRIDGGAPDLSAGSTWTAVLGL